MRGELNMLPACFSTESAVNVKRNAYCVKRERIGEWANSHIRIFAHSHLDELTLLCYHRNHD